MRGGMTLMAQPIDPAVTVWGQPGPERSRRERRFDNPPLLFYALPQSLHRAAGRADFYLLVQYVIAGQLKLPVQTARPRRSPGAHRDGFSSTTQGPGIGAVPGWSAIRKLPSVKLPGSRFHGPCLHRDLSADGICPCRASSVGAISISGGELALRMRVPEHNLDRHPV
jgi:hypothetical protein